MMKDMFYVPQQVPFLCYTHLNGELWDKTSWVESPVCLDLKTFPLCDEIEVDDLWGTVDIKRAVSPTNAVLLMANTIAHETRRGAGNVVIVSSQPLADSIKQDVTWSRLIVDPSLQENEIRVTFWKTHTNISGTQVLAVDGGVQYTPDGFSKLPNYQGYFKRGLM